MNAGGYEYMTAFLDILQAFDKIWYANLLYKIKSCFPSNLYTIIKSYLLQRAFKISYGEVATQLISYQLWSSRRQHAETDALSAIYRRSSRYPGYCNRNHANNTAILTV